MSVQLAAKGEPDVYITGKPSVTYFSSVYFRHSPFMKQTYEVPFDNQPVRTGFTSVCTLPVNGDIISNITLKTILPTSTPVTYYDGIGTRLISEARLTIGAQIISTLTGAYIDLQNDVNVPYENRAALTGLVGVSDTTISQKYLLTKLDFGLANLPMCCLGRHDIIVEIDFNPILASTQTTPNTITATFLVEYATIGEAERNWFTSSRQLYVYESMQYLPVTIVQGDNILSLNGVVTGSTKELYLTAQTPANSTTYTYSTALSGITLTFNSQDLISYDPVYWSLVEPFETKIVMPTRNVYMYTFNGPVNLSRIADIKLRLTATTGPLNIVLYAKTLNVFVAENGLGSFVFV